MKQHTDPNIKALISATKGLDRFARLLATENIIVEHSPTVTASFDLKRRLLTLPMWKNMDEPVYHMLSLHEVGHALFTPESGWMDVVKDEDKYLKSYVNVVEDARIDRKMKGKFPGGRADYEYAAKYLIEEDFFGLKQRPIHKCSFIDRLNVHFKAGQVIDVPFDDDERKFILKMETTSTFEDVVALAREILQFAKERRDEQASIDGDIDSFEFAEGDGDGDFINIDLDGDYEDGDGSSKAKGGNGQSGLNTTDLDSTTQDAMNSNLTKKHIDSRLLKDVRYVNVPEVRDEYRSFIVPYKQILESLVGAMNAASPSTQSGATERYREFISRNSKVVSYMVKEFEMKKAADSYARAKDAKTGIINPSKVHSYKYSEDIFRRLTVLPNGKNHGMVMFIDFSGSMQGHMNGTIQQLLSLVEFCRKTGIAHKVYAFTTGVCKEWMRAGNKIHIGNEENTIQIHGSNFRLLELFTSNMSRREYADMAKLMHEYGHTTGVRRSSWDRDYSYTDIFHNFFSLGSTPLNDTIILSHAIIRDFRKDSKLDVVHSIFLTDGESDGINVNGRGSMHGARILRDKRTMRQSYIDQHHEQTAFLLRNLRAEQNINVAVFRLIHSASDINQITNLRPDDLVRLRKEKHLVLSEVLGAKEFFAIMGGKHLDVEDMNLDDIEGNVTTNRLAKAFIKASNRRTMSRSMLVRFIDMIAGKATKVAID
jgi:hypothetical protein